MKDVSIERIGAFVIALVLTWVGLEITSKTLGTFNWHQTGGYVVHTAIRRHLIFYEPVIEYEYMLSGKVYRSSALRRDPFTTLLTYDEANLIIAENPPGSFVAVWFDTKWPANATLALYFGRGDLGGVWWFALVGFPLFLFFYAFTGGKILYRSDSSASSYISTISRDLNPKKDDGFK